MDSNTEISRVAIVGTGLIGSSLAACFLLGGLVISAAALAHAQEKGMVDPRVREQIEALNVKYDEAFNQNDAEAVAALFTADALETGPEEAALGQQEIEIVTKFSSSPTPKTMPPNLISSTRSATARSCSSSSRWASSAW